MKSKAEKKNRAPEGEAAPRADEETDVAVEAHEAGPAEATAPDEPDEKPSGEAREAEETAEESAGKLREELQTSQDKYLRLMAEFDNFKRRTVREYEQIVEAANERLMQQIIEVRENFERALKHGAGSAEYQSFYDGMKLIFTRFDEILHKNGLEPFTEVGDPFDPEIHDALMKTPHGEIAEDHVTQVYERGYRLKGKVIKHGRVIVSSGKPEEAAEAGPDGDSPPQEEPDAPVDRPESGKKD